MGNITAAAAQGHSASRSWAPSRTIQVADSSEHLHPPANRLPPRNLTVTNQGGWGARPTPTKMAPANKESRRRAPIVWNAQAPRRVTVVCSAMAPADAEGAGPCR